MDIENRPLWCVYFFVFRRNVMLVFHWRNLAPPTATVWPEVKEMMTFDKIIYGFDNSFNNHLISVLTIVSYTLFYVSELRSKFSNDLILVNRASTYINQKDKHCISSNFIETIDNQVYYLMSFTGNNAIIIFWNRSDIVKWNCRAFFTIAFYSKNRNVTYIP